MSDTDVCVSLNASTDAEIALHRQPAEVSGNVAKFPRWPDIATRDDNFRTYRCNSFLQPANALNFEELGYIYNDWGDAEQALAFLAVAAEKWRARLPDWMPRERYRINRAIALRQLGQYDEALRELNPMVTDSEWLDDALNVRGSIYFDQARKALIADRTEAGTTAARELLNKANEDYEAARTSASDQQQYVIVNLAQVSKTRGDIAQRLGDLATDPMQREANYNEATQHYIKAIELLKDSYGNTTRNTLVNNPHNKIAGLLVARARAALANTYVAMGKPQDATMYYARAEETYGEAIRDDGTFAAAYCGLASLNLILGKPEVAENYRKCVTFNPSALVGEVEVPHLIGLRRAAAIQTLAEVGLQPEIVTDGETVESQDPATGEQPVKIKIGTKVKISLQSVRQ
jgi:tetratricopeptide (TPR) repeat protein